MLEFIVLLMMEAKGVRNMQSILVVVNKHNTARVASLLVYYMLQTCDARKLKYKTLKIPSLKMQGGEVNEIGDNRFRAGSIKTLKHEK